MTMTTHLNMSLPGVFSLPCFTFKFPLCQQCQICLLPSVHFPRLIVLPSPEYTTSSSACQTPPPCLTQPVSPLPWTYPVLASRHLTVQTVKPLLCTLPSHWLSCAAGQTMSRLPTCPLPSLCACQPVGLPSMPIPLQFPPRPEGSPHS